MSQELPIDVLRACLQKALDQLPTHYRVRADDRFHAVTAVISLPDAGPLKTAFAEIFSKSWNDSNQNEATPEIEQLMQALQGMRPGQCLFTSHLTPTLLCYAALWPWQNGEQVSYRLGVFDSEVGVPRLTDAIQALVDVSRVDGPLPPHPSKE